MESFTIKRHSTLFFLIITLIPIWIQAQSDPFLQGIEAYESQDYEYALSKFDEAIENRYLMKGKDVPRVYYMRAKAMTEYYMALINANNGKKLYEHKGILLRAHTDLEQAKAFDDGRCSGIIADAHNQLAEVTLIFGQTIADSLRSKETRKLKDVDSLVSMVEQELRLVKHDVTSYLPQEILGVLAYKSGSFDLALKHLTESRKLYVSHPPENPDLDHVYNFYFCALIYHYEFLDFERALEEVAAGREFLAMGLVKMENNQNKSKKKEIRSLRKVLENLEFQVKLAQG